MAPRATPPASGILPPGELMRRLLFGSVSLLALAAAAPLSAQNALYGTYDLAAGFMPDPHVTSVTAGGGVDASTLPISDPTGASCLGYVNPGTPDVTINYTGGSFLRFGATSTADTTIIVALPDGSYRCNDDRWGLNPGVDINNPLGGAYNVWVGRYGTEGTVASSLLVSELTNDAPYTGTGPTAATSLYGAGTATALPSAGATGIPVNFSAAPLYGTLNLNAGFMPDPAVMAVTAGGGTPAYDTNIRTASGGNCYGSINTSAPDVRVQYSGGSFLRFYVQSSTDTTLLINAPDGTWHCVDDSVGLNPMIDFAGGPAGQYDVFVGTYSGGTSAATLNVTELTSMQPTP